jgi:hypothetical protein
VLAWKSRAPRVAADRLKFVPRLLCDARRTARFGSDEDELLQPSGVVRRHSLRDEAAERMADQRHPTQTHGVHERGHIAGEILLQVSAVRCVG